MYKPVEIGTNESYNISFSGYFSKGDFLLVEFDYFGDNEQLGEYFGGPSNWSVVLIFITLGCAYMVYRKYFYKKRKQYYEDIDEDEIELKES